MRDLDNSLNFNFSRFSSNGWQNLTLDDHSQDQSLLNRNAQSVNQAQNYITALLSDPPRPAANIYNCIESEVSENGSIREVSYAQNESEAKHVNSKQYFRMMKRRIKKVISKFNQGEQKNELIPNTNKKYLYESRHRHALDRPRGQDGKFLASTYLYYKARPYNERFRQKKKRGRKPKNYKEANEILTTIPIKK